MFITSRVAFVLLLLVAWSRPLVSQHSAPVCPASATATLYGCAEVLTGCICNAQTAVIASSKPNCTGCRFVYDFAWSCTNPYSQGDADGTVNLGCGNPNPPPLQFGTCVCDDEPLVTMNYSCGSCPSGD